MDGQSPGSLAKHVGQAGLPAIARTPGEAWEACAPLDLCSGQRQTVHWASRPDALGASHSTMYLTCAVAALHPLPAHQQKVHGVPCDSIGSGSGMQSPAYSRQPTSTPHKSGGVHGPHACSGGACNSGSTPTAAASRATQDTMCLPQLGRQGMQ